MDALPDAIERASRRALAHRAYFFFGSGWNSFEIARVLHVCEDFAVDLIHEGRKQAREPED